MCILSLDMQFLVSVVFSSTGRIDKIFVVIQVHQITRRTFIFYLIKMRTIKSAYFSVNLNCCIRRILAFH
jgi:hypothetical protein